MKNNHIIVLAALILFSMLSFSRADIVDRVIARVGTDIITLSELQEVAGNSEDNITEADRMKSLSALIDKILLVQEAKRQKIDILDNIIDLQVEKDIIEFKKRFPDNDTFNKWLSNKGLTLKALKLIRRDQVFQDAMIARLLRKQTPEITQSDLDDFSKENPVKVKEFDSQKYRISQIIIVLPDNPTDTNISASKEKALKAYESLKNGMSWEEAVQTYTEDSSTIDENGDMGYVGVGETFPEIEKAVASLKVGQFSQPIQTEAGIHIVKLTEKKSLADYLYRQRIEQYRTDLIKKLRETTPIIIKQ